VVVVDKPPGMTSHDVVARVRRLTSTRRVGHAGTLDPMATGVLVLGVERATRLLGHLMATTKEYDARIRLGQETTTDDAEGANLGGADASWLDAAAVKAAASRFVGELQQVPSAVSAIKVGGRRAYARVHAGETVTLGARPVRVDAFDVLALRPAPPYLDVNVTVTCSSGTYVRALARDLGRALGVGGHLTALRRTRSGAFTLDDAVILDALPERWELLPLAQVARRCFPIQQLDPEQVAMVRHGRALSRLRLPEPGPVALLGESGEFLALYEQHGPVARPLAVFVD
jgi:tRNA pseudouridine55 synthase